MCFLCTLPFIDITTNTPKPSTQSHPSRSPIIEYIVLSLNSNNPQSAIFRLNMNPKNVRKIPFVKLLKCFFNCTYNFFAFSWPANVRLERRPTTTPPRKKTKRLRVGRPFQALVRGLARGLPTLPVARSPPIMCYSDYFELPVTDSVDKTERKVRKEIPARTNSICDPSPCLTPAPALAPEGSPFHVL